MRTLVPAECELHRREKYARRHKSANADCNRKRERERIRHKSPSPFFHPTKKNLRLFLFMVLGLSLQLGIIDGHATPKPIDVCEVNGGSSALKPLV